VADQLWLVTRIREEEEDHDVLFDPIDGPGKSGRQRSTAADQMDKRRTLDQEDTDMHESGCRILP